MPDLETIASIAEKQLDPSRSGEFWPRMAVVDWGTERFKARFYPNIDLASLQEEVILQASRSIRMPVLLGRKDACLIFRIEPLDAAESVPDARLYTAIGQILGRLSTMRSPNEAHRFDLDREYARWLVELQDVGFIGARARADLQSRYEALSPGGSDVLIDYWDAMPHNFGWRDGTLFLLDEKHLRYSFPCVGLVKPSLLLDRRSFEQLLAGYSLESDPAVFHRHRDFLLLYYLVASLHFYNLQLRDGMRMVPANPRLRYYRSGLIRSLWTSPHGRLRESACFFFRYPIEACTAFINRIRQPISWTKIRERVSLEISPWDQDAF